MRLCFDTNAGIAENRYSLACTGTLRDLSALGVELQAGMQVTLYMDDQDLDGRPGLLVVDAVVEEYDGALIAHVDAGTWRREPVRVDAG